MRYNKNTIESRTPTKDSAMSIITVISGTGSDSHLVNEYGSMIAALSEKEKNKLLSKGVPEKVVQIKEPNKK